MKNPTGKSGIPGTTPRKQRTAQAGTENSAAHPGTSGSANDHRITRAARSEANKAEALRVQAQELELVRLEAARLAQAQPALLGRPSTYDDSQADALCAWIARGQSLRSWCAQADIPPETVYRWIRARADFRERYAQAHEDRADTLADELLEIADASAQDATIEGVAAAKLRVETRKWIASKLRPTRYGDRQEVAHTGGVSISIGIPQRPRPVEGDVIDAQPPSA